jgi:hypothetical protein
MADYRRKDAICTVSGKVIRPLDPNPDDIAIEDIAHSLANQCRFTGHTNQFYSVAQHSYLVSKHVESQLSFELDHNKICLWGLLHDGSEAYLADIARPIKRYEGDFGKIYSEIEDRLTKAIAEKFELPYPIPDIVMESDLVVFNAEVRDLMPEHPVFDRWVAEAEEIWPEKIIPWPPTEAKNQFLWRYEELTKGVK